MCVAVPMKVVEIAGTDCLAEIGGIRKKASLLAIQGVNVGDYILVHAGFAIEIVDPTAAEETLKIMRELPGWEEVIDEVR
jgi:hydrogenase expression/formation protein HypC